MSSRFRLFWLATASAVCLGTPAVAQNTVKIGELNSYKAQPAFLEPYKRGWELAVEDINAKGGVLGKKIEVISRDDGASPGDAVRVDARPLAGALHLLAVLLRPFDKAAEVLGELGRVVGGADDDSFDCPGSHVTGPPSPTRQDQSHRNARRLGRGPCALQR